MTWAAILESVTVAGRGGAGAGHLRVHGRSARPGAHAAGERAVRRQRAVRASGRLLAGLAVVHVNSLAAVQDELEQRPNWTSVTTVVSLVRYLPREPLSITIIIHDLSGSGRRLLGTDNGITTKEGLVTGITGQDGSYLAEFLLSAGYEVHGILRRTAASTSEESSGVFGMSSITCGSFGLN